MPGGEGVAWDYNLYSTYVPNTRNLIDKYNNIVIVLLFFYRNTIFLFV